MKSGVLMLLATTLVVATIVVAAGLWAGGSLLARKLSSGSAERTVVTERAQAPAKRAPPSLAAARTNVIPIDPENTEARQLDTETLQEEQSERTARKREAYAIDYAGFTAEPIDYTWSSERTRTIERVWPSAFNRFLSAKPECRFSNCAIEVRIPFQEEGKVRAAFVDMAAELGAGLRMGGYHDRGDVVQRWFLKFDRSGS